MLITTAHNEKLLEVPFFIRRSDNMTYYLKYQFDNDKNEYSLLITDLCLVWFEHGDFERIKYNAEKELAIEVKTKRASDMLLKKIQVAFTENASHSRIVKEKGHMKVHLPLEKRPKNDIASLSWIFDCRLLDQESFVDKKSWLSGPQVIFHHFIIPSQTIVNYFTENMLDNLLEGLNVTRTASSSMFTTNSLDYISTLYKGKYVTNGTSVAQESITQVIEEPEALKEQEQELERKRIVQEYNLKQQQKQPAPKKLKRL